MTCSDCAWCSPVPLLVQKRCIYACDDVLSSASSNEHGFLSPLGICALPTNSKSAAYWAIVLLVGFACVVRFVFLDADPYFPYWIGYVTDEGRWSEVSRNLVLFGSPEASRDARLHLMLSPAYQAGAFLSFKTLGVSLWSARLLAAASGALLVITMFLALRRHVSVFAIALGTIIVGYEPNMLWESRVALPEIPAALVSLWTFLILVLLAPTRANAFLAGLVGALAVAMKATNGPIVVAFLLIIVFAPGDESMRARLWRTVAFISGFLLVIVSGAALALASGIIELDGAMRASGRILSFVQFGDVTSIVLRMVDDPEMEIRNVMLLGMWFCSWIWIAAGRREASIVERLYIGSGIWAMCWLVFWSGNSYLPGRYVVHFIVPATINIMAGLALFRHESFSNMAAVLSAKPRGMARIALLLWLALPSAVVIAPIVIGTAHLVELDLSSFSARCAVTGALAGLIAFSPGWDHRLTRRLPLLLVLPVVLTLAWVGARALGLIGGWWVLGGAALTAFGALLVLAVVVFGTASTFGKLPLLQRSLVLVSLPFVAWVYGAQSAPTLINPQYSVRDASRNLESLLDDAASIRSMSASSLFLENTLDYRELTSSETSFDSVVFFQHGRVASQLNESGRLRQYMRVRTYSLSPSHRYEIDEAKDGPATIAVYRRRAPAGE